MHAALRPRVIVRTKSSFVGAVIFYFAAFAKTGLTFVGRLGAVAISLGIPELKWGDVSVFARRRPVPAPETQVGKVRECAGMTVCR
jgi:hypothetical protein